MEWLIPVVSNPEIAFSFVMPLCQVLQISLTNSDFVSGLFIPYSAIRACILMFITYVMLYYNSIYIHKDF